ncbi:hypothetical protein BH18THE2_BH18THE2_42010 [soil metagenome]
MVGLTIYKKEETCIVSFSLKWLGACISIGIILVLLLPFPYDLISVFGLCILINLLRGRRMMKRYGGTGRIKDILDSFSSSMFNNQRQWRLKY